MYDPISYLGDGNFKGYSKKFFTLREKILLPLAAIFVATDVYLLWYANELGFLSLY